MLTLLRGCHRGVWAEERTFYAWESAFAKALRSGAKTPDAYVIASAKCGIFQGECSVPDVREVWVRVN